MGKQSCIISCSSLTQVDGNLPFQTSPTAELSLFYTLLSFVVLSTSFKKASVSTPVCDTSQCNNSMVKSRFAPLYTSSFSSFHIIIIFITKTCFGSNISSFIYLCTLPSISLLFLLLSLSFKTTMMMMTVMIINMFHTFSLRVIF